MTFPDISLKWMLENAADKELWLRDSWRTDLGPDPVGGAVNRSDRHVFRLFARCRPITGEARIHYSVYSRKEALGSGYAPGNLRESHGVVGGPGEGEDLVWA